jgi:gamma-glutamyltranspeptidase / glutathione hydrolase
MLPDITGKEISMHSTWRHLHLSLMVAIAACTSTAPPPPASSAPSAHEEATLAVGARGMVSTAHPIATEAGLEILRKGGNAFDAAVTIASTLNVVEPMMTGMGGYGTILVYDATKGESLYLDASGKIPMAVDSDVYRPPTPNYMENRRNAKAVSTPGAANAWEAMSRRYGKLPWDEVLEPAIRVAEEGFVIDARTAGFIERAFPEFPEHAQSFYGKEGKPLAAGDRLIQKDLGKSLRLLSKEGAKAIYGGSIGRAIDEAMKEAGGFLRYEDLVNDKAEWWEPIRVSYRGYEVVTPSAPAGAFPMLVRLGMMSLVDVHELGHNSLAYLHRFAEVTKRAYWMRLAYSGDPEVKPPPYDMLLSKSYWEEQSARIDPDHAWTFDREGIMAAQSQNTTHFVVADEWGNVVSATVTLGNLFGSRIMPKGTGIWLNNSLAYCTFEPKGNPMDAHPGRRKLSSDSPAFVLRDGRPWVAVGTPGGHTITQAVAQMIMNVVDFHMNIQEAIAAPRIAFVEPDVLVVEEGIPQSIRDQLAARGHHIDIGTIGNAHGLAIEYDESGKPVRFTGGTDPRGGGLAEGY